MKKNQLKPGSYLVFNSPESGSQVFSMAGMESPDWDNIEKNEEAYETLNSAYTYMEERSNRGEDLTFDYNDLQAIRLAAIAEEIIEKSIDKAVEETISENDPDGLIERATIITGALEEAIRSMIYTYSRTKWYYVQIPEIRNQIISKDGNRYPDSSPEQGEA